MLWYDPINTKNSSLFYKKHRRNQNKYERSYRLLALNNSKISRSKLYFYLPPNYKLALIQSTFSKTYHIFCWSNKYYMKVPVSRLLWPLHFDYYTRTCLFRPLLINNYVKTYLTTLTLFTGILTKPLFFKVQFKGKGYYIYKSYRNTITPQFGYSHRLYLYTPFLYFKFLNKTTLVIFGLNMPSLKRVSTTMYCWRPVNIFTGRGVRFAKQIIYRKSGKISSYR